MIRLFSYVNSRDIAMYKTLRDTMLTLTAPNSKCIQTAHQRNQHVTASYHDNIVIISLLLHHVNHS